MNNHFINLINNKSLLYNLIYNLRPIKIKTLKTYIKTNLANGYIKLFKFSANILILLIYKKETIFNHILIVSI